MAHICKILNQFIIPKHVSAYSEKINTNLFGMLLRDYLFKHVCFIYDQISLLDVFSPQFRITDETSKV